MEIKERGCNLGNTIYRKHSMYRQTDLYFNWYKFYVKKKQSLMQSAWKQQSKQVTPSCTLTHDILMIFKQTRLSVQISTSQITSPHPHQSTSEQHKAWRYPAGRSEHYKVDTNSIVWMIFLSQRASNFRYSSPHFLMKILRTNPSQMFDACRFHVRSVRRSGLPP